MALYIDLFVIILLHSLNKSSWEIFNSEIVLLSTYPSTSNICKIAGSDTSSQFQDCLFPFLNFLSIFVCYQSASLICDNSADVCDARLKVGSNVGWAVLARSGHKSHITTTLHTGQSLLSLMPSVHGNFNKVPILSSLFQIILTSYCQLNTVFQLAEQDDDSRYDSGL